MNAIVYTPRTRAGTRGQRGGEGKHSFIAYLSLAHSAYYLITGVWPLVSISTFQKVTGPKTDAWLVKTVGVLVSIIGAVIGLAARRGNTGPEVKILAVGSALGLAGIDVVYVAQRRIAPIYLLDALAEVLLAGGWMASG